MKNIPKILLKCLAIESYIPTFALRKKKRIEILSKEIKEKVESFLNKLE